MSKRDALVEITSKMPFVGRHIVRPAYLWGREAARDGDYVRKAASGVFLGAFALLHAQQAKMGIDATRYITPMTVVSWQLLRQHTMRFIQSPIRP